MKQRFNPKRELKRFLHPELAKRYGEISEMWDDELLQLFPDAFEEIKDVPVSAEELVNSLIRYDQRIDSYLVSRMELLTFVKRVEANNELRHAPKKSSDLIISEFLNELTITKYGGDGMMTVNMISVDYLPYLIEAWDKNRGFDEN